MYMRFGEAKEERGFKEWFEGSGVSAAYGMHIYGEQGGRRDFLYVCICTAPSAMVSWFINRAHRCYHNMKKNKIGLLCLPIASYPRTLEQFASIDRLSLTRRFSSESRLSQWENWGREKKVIWARVHSDSVLQSRMGSSLPDLWSQITFSQPLQAERRNWIRLIIYLIQRSISARTTHYRRRSQNPSNG